MENQQPLTDAHGEVRELTEVDFQRMRPASEVLPELFGAELAAEMLKPKKGRLHKNVPMNDVLKSIQNLSLLNCWFLTVQHRTPLNLHINRHSFNQPQQLF
jgi:hypothetical protein